MTLSELILSAEQQADGWSLSEDPHLITVAKGGLELFAFSVEGVESRAGLMRDVNALIFDWEREHDQAETELAAALVGTEPQHLDTEREGAADAAMPLELE